MLGVKGTRGSWATAGGLVVVDAVCATQSTCDALERGCSSNLPVRVLMSAEEDGEASDSEGDGQGWEDAADTASSEQECDKVTSCFASGKRRQHTAA